MLPRPARLLLAPALLGVLALTGCGDGDTAGSAATDSAASATPQTPEASDSPQTTEAPAATPATEPEPTSDSDSESSESDTEASVDDESDFPDVVDPVEQGGTYGVVVLSAGSKAELTASEESAAEYGFTAYEAEIGCLQGAGEALGIADGAIVSHLVFGDIDAAQDFVSLYTYLDDDAEVVGAAQAKTYCVDG